MFARVAPMVLVLVVALHSGSLGLRAQPMTGPLLSLGQVLGGGNGYSLFVTGSTATNFLLEASADLVTWSPVFQAFGSPGTNPVYQVMDELQGNDQRFWRALPGEDVAVMEEHWRDSEPLEYTFRLRHMVSFWEGGLRGTVRVRQGALVEVTNAVDDRTLQPIAEPELDDFLTMAQLFGEIRREIETGSQQIQVQYDPSRLYPERIWMDRYVSMVDDESVYEVSDFVVVEP